MSSFHFNITHLYSKSLAQFYLPIYACYVCWSSVCAYGLVCFSVCMYVCVCVWGSACAY